MGCRVILVRHGETVWNNDGRLQGQTDIPLSENGINQAHALSKRMSGWNISAFMASNLTRAKETAAIIAKPHNKDVIILPGLQEINFGHWEGLTVEEIRHKYNKASSAWWASPLRTRIPGGETLGELVERSVKAVKSIVENYSGQQVVVVTHGGTIRSIVGTVLGLDLNHYWRLRQDNASVTIIDFHSWEEGILTVYNDVGHLENI